MAAFLPKCEFLEKNAQMISSQQKRHMRRQRHGQMTAVHMSTSQIWCTSEERSEHQTKGRLPNIREEEQLP